MEDYDKDLDKFITEMDQETLEAISFNVMGDFGDNKPGSLDYEPASLDYEPASPAGDKVVKRFANISSDEIDSFLKVNENKNTSKKNPKCDINTFQEYLRAVGEFRVPEVIPPFQLNPLIASFLLSVKKKDGTEYEPTSLRCYISSIDRYLKQKEYGYSIINDIQFCKTREVLKTKQKQLKSLGKGNKPFAADEVSENEFSIFYEKKILGAHTPTSLINSMFTICTNHFGMRPGKEIHDLTWGDIQLRFDDAENREYIVFSQERQTKTRTGANPRDIRKVKPRAYATPDYPEKDPVSLYKKYSEVRPNDTKEENSPFFLAVNTSADLGNPKSVWYKRNAMGINKLYGLVKQMKISAGIASDKRLTNHSMRKHLVQRLSDAGVPANQITQISGHRNINSINNYSKINSEQHREISEILTSADKSTLPFHHGIHAPKPQTVAMPPESACDPSRMEYPLSNIKSMFSGNTFNGQVTFNLSYGDQTKHTCMSNAQYNMATHDSSFASPPRKVFKRILPIDSDSE